MKILIDSDVCLDFLTGREPYFNTAKRLFWKIEDTEVVGLVSPDSFSNIFYVLRKYYKRTIIISKLKGFRELISVAPLSEQHIDQALYSGWTDFEDAMQYFCAREANCSSIVTRNTDDYSKSELPVFTSFEFLNQ
ncbi:MAG TPA: PIN domain-containing protein [Fodinibius sp.]|nr:PIN domain-containing protein [Fodinibius sp.]